VSRSGKRVTSAGSGTTAVNTTYSWPLPSSSSCAARYASMRLVYSLPSTGKRIFMEQSGSASIAMVQAVAGEAVDPDQVPAGRALTGGGGGMASAVREMRSSSARTRDGTMRALGITAAIGMAGG